MFHLHTFEGIHNNISLEQIKRHSKVKQISKKSKSRKYIQDDSKQDNELAAGGKYNYAVKAYKKAINVTDDRQPIFHAHQIMSSPVKTIKPETLTKDAWHIFRKEEVKYMPVLIDDTISGIVSITDLLEHIIISDQQIEKAHNLSVREIMSSEVITAEPVTDIRRIAKAMFEQHVGTMPITYNDKLVGIITRSDILHAIIHYPSLKLWA